MVAGRAGRHDEAMSTVTTASAPLQIDWDDAQPPGRVTVRPRTGLTSKRTWGELAYALVDLAPSIFFFAALVALLTAGIGLTVVYVGIGVLMAALLLARLGGALQVVLARSLLGMPVLLPGRFRRRSPGLAGLVGSVLRDGAAWRAVAYFLIKIALAPVTFAMAIGLYAWAFGAVTYPAWRGYLPAQLGTDGAWHRGTQLWNGYFVDTWPAMALLAAVGLAVLLAAPHLLRAVVAIDRRLIGALLARR
jgi:hypothetical protein